MSYIIEAEFGTYTGTRRRHNGYYAGDFRSTPMASREQLDRVTRMRPPTLRRPSS
jgi:hypothetical protein